jgi:diguanylate cyclase
MAQDDFVTLNLGGQAGAPAATGDARLLDGALALIRDMLLAEDAPGRAALAQRFEACRTANAGGAPHAEIAALGAACLAEGREAVAALQSLEAARAREMAALVLALRDVVTSVGTEMSSLNGGLQATASRFDALRALADPVQIKRRLFEEVVALKELTLSRHQAWEEAARRMNQRIETLEDQLIATRSEASTDPLTQISNRRTFEQNCEVWVQTPRASFVLALIDVDDLKHINDGHGHDAGDAVLHFVAQTFARSLRPGDLVARLGGDEFAVLAPNLTLARAEQRLRTILSSITDPALARLERPPQMTGVSCGVAEFSAGDTYKTLFKRADEALYDAKRQGKNRLVARQAPFIKDLLRK